MLSLFATYEQATFNAGLPGSGPDDGKTRRACELSVTSGYKHVWQHVAKPVPVLLTLIVFAFAIFYVMKYTILLRRFTAIFEYGVDFLDPYFLIIAFGGRFEEVSGILSYFQSNPYQIFFGAPPGTHYTWLVQYSQYEELKNYAHFTPIGMVFRYGIVYTAFIYGLFIYTFIKRWAPNDPVFLVCISIFVGSFFGANLIIDPITWIFWVF